MSYYMWWYRHDSNDKSRSPLKSTPIYRYLKQPAGMTWFLFWSLHALTFSFFKDLLSFGEYQALILRVVEWTSPEEHNVTSVDCGVWSWKDLVKIPALCCPRVGATTSQPPKQGGHMQNIPPSIIQRRGDFWASGGKVKAVKWRWAWKRRRSPPVGLWRWARAGDCGA